MFIFKDSDTRIEMNLIRLRMSMLGTVALIIAVSTLGLGAILSMSGAFNIYTLILLVAVFNIAQWLIAPYLVNSIYGVRPLIQMKPLDFTQWFRNFLRGLVSTRQNS